MTFQLSEELLQEVLNYLSSKPYGEVSPLLHKLLPVIQEQVQAYKAAQAAATVPKAE